jgi:murein DD-endopeptidase MepM/ murein hydrolase activator NlpD
MLRAIAGLTAALVAGLSLLGGAGAAVLDSATTGFVKPVTGAVITQPFGCTSFALEPVDPDCPGGHFHSGIDLAVAAGTPVHATLAGVAQVIDDTTGYGLHIIIDHADGLSSLYGHLESVCVTTGEDVAAGEVIGQVGSTGDSTGPHLHFEIRVKGTPENPQQFLELP